MISQKCPSAYGDKFTDTYHNTTSIVSSTYSYTMNSNVTVDQAVDGSGTLVLPCGTFKNILRTKTVNVRHDTMSMNGTITPSSNITNTSYTWCTTNGDVQLTIGYSQLTETMLMKYISFSRNAKTMGVIDIAHKAINPSAVSISGNRLHISGVDKNCPIKLFSLNGRQAEVRSLSSIDVSRLTPGVWFYEVLSKVSLRGKFNLQ
jgi:hypothetical protein